MLIPCVKKGGKAPRRAAQPAAVGVGVGGALGERVGVSVSESGAPGAGDNVGV